MQNREELKQKGCDTSKKEKKNVLQNRQRISYLVRGGGGRE
jgi:hypothetical protein